MAHVLAKHGSSVIEHLCGAVENGPYGTFGKRVCQVSRPRRRAAISRPKPALTLARSTPPTNTVAVMFSAFAVGLLAYSSF
jgi:hypothetical protein